MRETVPHTSSREKINVMAVVLAFTLLITGVKFAAWLLTHSNAIFTDALESVINVVAGGFALFAAWFAAQPKDAGHPYGHGKIEFLSAGFEGGLVLLAGIATLVRAVWGWFHPAPIESIDLGLILSIATGTANLLLGLTLLRRGRKLNSLLLIADGKHLLTDTVTSAGLIAGLLLIWLTGWLWLDNAIAALLGLTILLTGYQLVKASLAGLLDETDYQLVNDLITVMQQNRVDRWIDVHNMRVIKYGSSIHVDCHLTLPWYLTLEEAHAEVNALELLIRDRFDLVEFFIHSDPCIPASCTVCQLQNCPQRKHPFTEKKEWKFELLLNDEKHHA